MAGEHHEDASLYDFLIDDTEMMATTPSGHLDFEDRAQQPISAPNRTSSERRLELDLEGPLAPAGSAGASPRNIPAPGAPASITATTAFGDHQQLPGASRVSHQQHQQHHAQFDLHGHSAPATASYFARPPLPTTSLSHVPIDWTLYGAQQHPQVPNLSLSHHGQFHFDVPQHSPILSHMPQHHPTDPALSYGSDLVSPTNIHHASSSHYPFGVPWDDGGGGGHESSTPTGTTPAGAPPISNNPWVDPEDAQNDEETATAASRGKQKSRPRRSKRTARQTGESPAGPSTEPTSPSSISQNSRASITSKSASIASTSTSSSRPSKLRSASRTSKNSHSKPNDTPEERRTRASHNLVEKQYRNRLNAQFESLLSSLPETLRAGEGDESETGPQDFGDRRVSKGEVLEMARKHIQSLERERDQLEHEKNELLGNLQRLKGSVSGEASPAGLGTPIDFNINMDDEQQHQADEQDEK